MNVTFKHLSGSELVNYFDELASLRITFFKEFPYLYEGNIDYEKEYLQVYQNSQNSKVILAFVEGRIIGATTCIALTDEAEEFKKSFREHGFDIFKIMYFGESIILKEYRGHKIGHKFFELHEEFAKRNINDLEYTTFCAVDRPLDHPLKPQGYRSLDSFWQRLGYSKHGEMKVYFPWKDIDQSVESTKSMTIWLKSWK